MSDDRDLEDSSPAGLWEAAKDLMRWLFAAYGRPVDIVAMGPLTAKEHREISSWLAAVERIARRLLVVEASKLVGMLPAIVKRTAPPSTPRTAPRESKRIERDPENPSQWRVSFRVPMARNSGRDKLCSPTGELSRACATEGDCLAAGGFAASSGSSAFEASGNPPQSRRAPPGDPAPPWGSREAVDPLQGVSLRSAWPLAERIEAARRVLNDPAPYALRLARCLRGEPQRAAAIIQPERGSEAETLGRWAYGHALTHAREAVPAFDTS
ncbi:MAG: hypothetical protein PVI23_01420 [Maricaulaceae bacterium]|jgi:hypothetical protein